MKKLLQTACIFALGLSACLSTQAADSLIFEPPANSANGKQIVLVAGDEEYRTEESMPMLAKILSQKHGFKCTVLFSFGPDGAEYIDPNNQAGLRGLVALDTADLMIIGTRFRQPDAKQAEHITNFLNAGKPVIGIRTSTHAFRGGGKFGDITFDDFGLKVLGETWVSHHGKHKQEGARGVVEPAYSNHPVVRGVKDVFALSDVYGVIHLSDADQVVMRAAVTDTLDPTSANIAGEKNSPMQPFVWMHTYTRPNGKGTGQAICTTGGASVDFLNDGMRRVVINSALYLTGREVPAAADVSFVDAFEPSFYGFINEKEYWKNTNLKPEELGLGKSRKMPDPKGTPDWKFDKAANQKKGDQSNSLPLNFHEQERVVMVGGSLAERMNLYGYFETLLHTRFADKQVKFRNFGWPTDEVGNQQRPDNYTKIDDPLAVFSPELFLCFFGGNERFAGEAPESLESFQKQYKQWIADTTKRFSKDGKEPRFVLISPIAFEMTNDKHLPKGTQDNQQLAAYTKAVKQVADDLSLPFVDLFTPTSQLFSTEAGAQYTINGLHANEAGDRAIAEQLDSQLFRSPHPLGMDVSKFHQLREVVNDKSWLHLQDYRMLNGWYVYGGRRTWDTETFPREFQKIRKMVAVRDQYIWDVLAGKPVPDKPDDSKTGELFQPETMFGTRDEGFRNGREPKTLVYPTPEESIAQMEVPEGFEVQLVASEREFPEFANPTQVNFDSRGRLWVSCMINYPQWLPGAAKPGDKLFIFEDTNGDGKADECKTFYDKLICPTGFEFYKDGVLVVDEPRILFLRDTDGDDKADEVTQVIDGIGTDDTHHTVGAWEYSHGGRIFMLEGVSMSTAMETPWGPFRKRGASGSYVLDPLAWKFTHFKTPGYGNPWCMVFDQWGQGVIGDGTNAQQHWTSPLSGFDVPSRRTLTPNFDNQGMRPAVGNDFLITRQFPDDVQGQFIYACVINMHGLPRFEVNDEEGTAGFAGKRIADLLKSTDMFFRPVDPQIGPDGALWFGDWCNALIGHMQYSQRDPNRDHVHGRMYRLVYKPKPLLEPVTQAGKSVPELLKQLTEYEPRTRYRARRELRTRDESEVLSATEKWISGKVSPNQLCEALWLQESFRKIDPKLVSRIMATDEFHARAAAVHAVTNEIERYPGALDLFKQAVADEHPRVRLEAIRGLSFIHTPEAAEVALRVVDKPLDYWIEYTLEHTLQALRPTAQEAERNGSFLAGASQKLKDYYAAYKLSTGPGGQAVRPLKAAEDPNASPRERQRAMNQLAGINGGKAAQGEVVFTRVCSACHIIGNNGKAFGPKLDDVGSRYSKADIIKHVLWPNETIAKGYETVQVVNSSSQVFNGFIIKETDKELTLGVATNDGKGKEAVIPKDEIEVRKEMKASSMPEGLIKTIAPGEFLDLVEYLVAQRKFVIQEGGWIETGLADGPLRKHLEFEEISRDAQLQLGADFPANWREHANLVLSAVDPKSREFSFHSPNEDAQSPAVAIRLSAPSEIRHITLQNRRNPQFYDRAKDLAVWISDDGQEWKQVWKSEKPEAEWSIDLPAGTKGRFLKVGLDGKGILHLNQIVVYGKKSPN